MKRTVITGVMAGVILGVSLFCPPLARAAEPAVVTASDGGAGDGFGIAMARWDRFVAIGAPNADVEGRGDQGAVHLFERADCTLREVAKLVASDGGAGDGFGASVAMRGNVLLVGAPGADGEQADHGAVYVFVRRGDTWAETDKLFARDGAVSANFGASVATDERRAIVGAPQAVGRFGISSGAAYVFEQRRGSWQQAGELRPSDFDFMEAFGSDVAIDDEWAFVGAPGSDDSDGSLYLFERGDDEDDWEQEERLRNGSRGSDWRLGSSLAITGSHLVVGAPGGESDDTHLSGVVWIFERDDDDLENRVELTAGDWTAEAEFGSAVSMDERRLAVTAGNAGKVYLFDRDNDWRQAAMLTAPAANEEYGTSLAVMEDLVIIGAPGADNGRGAVYVYAGITAGPE